MPGKKKQTTAPQTQAFETLADQKRNKGQSNAFLQQQTGQALLQGQSAAADPNFEKKAAQFEMTFGKAAMGHGSVTTTVQTLCDQIATIVQAAWAQTNADKELNMASEIGKWCGTRPDMKGVAGAVPKDQVYAHMFNGAGNIRTQMTALYNFGRPFQKKLDELNKANKTEAFLQTLREQGAQTDALSARAASLKENPTGRLTPSPRDTNETAVALQAETRGEFANKSAHQSTRTADDVGLTKDEAAFQGLGEDYGSQRVLWEEGARKWLINENNAWVQSIRELSLPLKAGPSGTTDRIMQTRELLGVSSAVETRGACLAYLLPINAHSMVEIMEGAARFGCPYTPGPGMYANVAPFGSLEAYAPDAQWWATVVGSNTESASSETTES